MQARQRLIQLDNSRLDAVWAATQAQADLLLALGTPSLIQAMLSQAEREDAPGASVPAPAPSPSPATSARTGAPGSSRAAAPAVNPPAPTPSAARR
jgi:hypothetical protein